MRDAVRIAVLATALMSAHGATFAADPPRKEGSLGGGKGSGAYLTKEQLRSCLARQAGNKTQDAELLKEQAAIAGQKDEITRVGDALKASLESVDRSSAEAIAAYNEAVQARDRQIDAYQARVDGFNARVEAQQAERAVYAKDCSNRRYLEEDEAALRKGK